MAADQQVNGANGNGDLTPNQKRAITMKKQRDHASERIKRTLQQRYFAVDVVPTLLIEALSQVSLHRRNVNIKLTQQGEVRADGSPNPLLDKLSMLSGRGL